MLDKLIIGLLLIILPVGVFMARKLESQAGNSEAVDQAAIEKVDALISQINQAVESKSEPTAPPFTISSVHLSTESATVKVAGVAPKNNAQVMVSAVVVQTDTELITPTKAVVKTEADSSESAEASGSATKPTSTKIPTPGVLGKAVQVLAIPVKADGVFTFDYPVSEEELAGLERLEIRLEQGSSSTTVIYNPERKTFEQI